MSKENDERIIKLKKQIEDKKEVLKTKSTRFSPITNCNFEFEGIKCNIHTLNKIQIIPLLVKLKTYEDTAKKMGLLEDYMIGTFNISDWISDLKSKVENLKVQEEVRELKKLEDKLTKMLSSEKQTEIELDNIEKLLK